MRYLASALLVACGTVIVLALDANATTAVLVLLLAVIAASLAGRGPGLAGSVLATMSLSYWFIPPERELSLGKREEFVALLTFAIVALVVSTLLVRARDAHIAELSQARRASEAEAVAQIDRGRAAFFAAAGHNLRTPLTTIRTAAETLTLLGAGRAVPDAEQRLVAVVRDEALRLERLIDKVLTLSRTRTGVVPERGAVDLPGLVQASIARLGEPAARFAWDMDLRDTDEVPALDGLMVEQILLNLLENSVHHAPEGSRIEVRGHADGDGYLLAVSDDGPGIDPGRRDAIFDEFHTTAARADRASVGLGLAIVRSLVEAHHGSIRCTSVVPHGARFEMWFPAEERA
jgi:two-component system sensor histidine kinase KdpD